jgi:hypothetical protein
VTVLRWLAKPPVAAVLSGIAAGGRDLSHGELDRLEQTPVLAHLRSVLVATRDERMTRLERFAGEVTDGLPGPEQRQARHPRAVQRRARAGPRRRRPAQLAGCPGPDPGHMRPGRSRRMALGQRDLPPPRRGALRPLGRPAAARPADRMSPRETPAGGCAGRVLPRHFRCSGRERPCAPGWLATEKPGFRSHRLIRRAGAVAEPTALPRRLRARGGLSRVLVRLRDHPRARQPVHRPGGPQVSRAHSMTWEALEKAGADLLRTRGPAAL